MKIKTTIIFKLKRIGRTGILRNEKFVSIKQSLKILISKKYIMLREDRLEKEIYSSCILLKNLAIVYKEMPMSLDFILEELKEGSRLLNETYSDILSAYRNGKGKEGLEIFCERVPTKAGKNFAKLLEKLDQINPAELTIYMEAFEETLRGERMTKGVKRSEKKSLLITAAATASIFAIMLNFTVVVVFMDTLRKLEEII